MLLAISGYMYGNKAVDRTGELAEVLAALPSLTHLVTVGYGDFSLDKNSREAFTTGSGLEHAIDVVDYAGLGATSASADGGATSAELEFEPVPFDHPLFILFSSGTTGKPKAIVHSHGGILLETLKNHALHFDLGPGSQFCWFSTTAWMMWNTLVGGLVLGSGDRHDRRQPELPGSEGTLAHRREHESHTHGCGARGDHVRAQGRVQPHRGIRPVRGLPVRSRRRTTACRGLRMGHTTNSARTCCSM